MKPVVICRFAPHEGPGYFATYLEARRLPWQLVRLDRDESLPAAKDIAGLGLMGGPMSVNDDLPWIPEVLRLIRHCVAQDVPVIGHCLGGQLLSKALGGEVGPNPVKEIGWGEVKALPGSGAGDWGPAERFLSFHWHGETFSIPQGAERIWSSIHCANQAFVVGPHLGMQCHIEMTEDLIEDWCRTGREEIEGSIGDSPAVQNAEAIRETLFDRLEALHAVAERVYDRWTRALAGWESPATGAR